MNWRKQVHNLLRRLPPGIKVEIVRAMGFSPSRDVHTPDCPAGMSSGYVCQCVPDATVWSQPRDVNVHRHETWEERLARRSR